MRARGRREQELHSPRVLGALAAPIRHDILDRLLALGPTSVRDLARALGRAPTAIYAHLRRLEALGLVRREQSTPAGQARGKGRPAAVYEATASMFRVTQAARRPANRAVMRKIVAAASRQAARDFGKALLDPGRVSSGAQRNFGFFRAIGAPSSRRLARINALLQEVSALLREPDPEAGPVISLAWFLAPVADRLPAAERPVRHPR